MKRMVLVPPSHTLPSPLSRKLTQLDEEMKTILLRTDLDESSKALAYSQVLDKYLKVKEQLQTPEPIKIIEEKVVPTSDATAERGEQSDLDLNAFPKQYRSRAENLLRHMKKSSDLSWNRRGELTKNDNPIQGTNIFDLVYNVIRPSKGTSPFGSDQFIAALKKSNVPESWLTNKYRSHGSALPVRNESGDVHTPFSSPLTLTAGRKSNRPTTLPARLQSPSWEFL